MRALCFGSCATASVRVSLQRVYTLFPFLRHAAIFLIMRHKTGNGHNVSLEQFLDDIKTVVQDGEQLLKAGAVEAKQRAIAGAQSTDKMIRSHPYQTLGLLFGLGVLAGLLMSGAFSAGSEETED